MAKNNNLTDFLTSLADKMRSLLNSEEKINPQTFEDKLSEIYEKQRGDFWDCFQNFGKRKDYSYAFKNGDYGFAENVGWCKENWKPKYDITPTSAKEMFRNFLMRGDIAEYLKNLGITLDFSQCTNFEMAFYNSFINGTLPTVDMTSATTTTNAFRGCNAQKVEKIIFAEDKTYSSDMFSGNCKIQTVVFEGVLSSSINVSGTQFNHDTLISLINVLKDYSKTTTTKTLTLGDTLKAKLTEEEIAVATEKGWITE